jgi:hypothetical protein
MCEKINAMAEAHSPAMTSETIAIILSHSIPSHSRRIGLATLVPPNCATKRLAPVLLD